MIVTERLKRFDRSWRYVSQKDVPYYWLSKSRVTSEVVNDFIDYCLIWCVRKFGESSGIDIPSIEWEWNYSDLSHANMLAVYDSEENSIHIRIQGHRTFYNLASTIIHEYIHYLQPRAGNWYDRHYRRYDYDNHPYELEAYYLSHLYDSECARWSMHQIELNNR